MLFNLLILMLSFLPEVKSGLDLSVSLLILVPPPQLRSIKYVSSYAGTEYLSIQAGGAQTNSFWLADLSHSHLSSDQEQFSKVNSARKSRGEKSWKINNGLSSSSKSKTNISTEKSWQCWTWVMTDAVIKLMEARRRRRGIVFKWIQFDGIFVNHQENTFCWQKTSNKSNKDGYIYFIWQYGTLAHPQL